MSLATFNQSHIRTIHDIGLQNMISALWQWKAKEGIKIVQRAINSLSVQTQQDIVVDGWLGDKSIAALNALDVNQVHGALMVQFSELEEYNEPHYLTIARAELGVKEIKGRNHNRRVLKYHSVSGGFKTDEVPWCGSFVNWVMKESGYKTVRYPARAKSWRKFGKGTREPYLGSIAVKSRKGGGHVCFVVGKSKNGKYLYCLGGNQGDAVTIRKYRANVFTHFRMPKNTEPIALAVYNGGARKAGREV